MIDVKGLTKEYDSVKAIDNLSFTINKGDIVGFLGPNGAGKTTTMKLLTCFIPPTSGTASINGLSIIDDAFAIKTMIGYLPENNPIYTDMTVIDYLTFIANIRKIKDPHPHLKRVIDLCELGNVINKPIEDCSKGFKQRVGLAQSLIHKPDILILDEPTVGLDPNQIIEIRHLIKELGKETTILLCSHILSEVSATCSNIFILKEGSIIAKGSPQEIQNKGNHKKHIYLDITASLHDLEEVIQKNKLKIESIKEMEKKDPFNRYELKSSQDYRAELFKLAVSKKWTLRELKIEESTLEDAFIELTKQSKCLL
tara:strand:+ start:174 stop:1109 length:936 start_codon:yes stop_codon:yes gene_type:complete